MLRKITLIPMILILAVLGGCGGGKMVLKPDAVNQVKTVALLQIPEPTYRILNLGSPAAAMGAVGAAVNASGSTIRVKTERTDAPFVDFSSLEEILKDAEYSVAQHLISEISSQLEKSGFNVKIIDVERAENELFEDYSGINTEGADAVIDIIVSNAGYVTEHFMFSPEWRPEARAMISMRATNSSEVIYKETLMYGYHNPMMSATDLDAPPEYAYETQEEIFLAGIDNVLAGLKDATKSIASHVAIQLRKQN